MRTSQKGLDLIKKYEGFFSKPYLDPVGITIPCFIYTLCDPITNDIRYIGKTIAPHKRLEKHIRESKKARYRKECWIKSLLNKNLKPTMEIIDVVDFEDSGLIEEMYISQFKGWGFNLTNLQSRSANGIGRHSKETRLKISKKLTGKKQTKETIEKIRISVTKSWENEELRHRQRERSIILNNLGVIGNKGIKDSYETRVKKSISLKNYYKNNAHAQLGVPSKKIWNPSNKSDIIFEYQNSKMSVQEISDKYSVNRNMITRLMKREGVELRNNGRKKISYIDLKNFIDKGYKTIDISKEMGCSISQVEKYKKMYNLTKTLK